jgi:hypothetical protein
MAEISGGHYWPAIVKAIQLKYQTAPKAGAIPDYAVAAAGTVGHRRRLIHPGRQRPHQGQRPQRRHDQRHPDFDQRQRCQW